MKHTLCVNLFICLIPLIITIFENGCELSRDSRINLIKENKPNIIFILADDMGYGDLRAFNPLSKIPTPQTESLANQGIRFTDAHSSAPWCVPSRYGFLTGRYPYGMETKWNETNLIEPNRLTIADLLKRKGYRTGMVGKWHEGFRDFKEWLANGGKDRLIGGPVDHGFDYYFGIPASLDLPPYFYIYNDHAVVSPTDSIVASSSPQTADVQGKFWRGGKIAPGFKHEDVLPTLTKKALEFIDEGSNKKQPFFLYFALTGPHTPWLPSKEYEGKSGAGLYGDFVMQVDDVVGRINKEVIKNGVEKNTLIIFASDNGPVWFQKDVSQTGHYSTGVFRGIKFDSWEGGHRIPFIAKWPGKISPGGYSDALLDLTDMMATFNAISGNINQVASTIYNSSYDQTPVLLGEKKSVRKILPNANSIRVDQWKLIIGNGWTNFEKAHEPGGVFQKTGFELYNLNSDLPERNNLYNEFPDKVQQLKKLHEKVIENNK